MRTILLPQRAITESCELAPWASNPTPNEPTFEPTKNLRKAYFVRLMSASWQPTRTTTRELTDGGTEQSHYGKWVWIWEVIES